MAAVKHNTIMVVYIQKIAVFYNIKSPDILIFQA